MEIWKKTLLIYFLILPITGYSQSNCKDLPKTFYSYAEAISKVKSAKFSFVDNLNTSRSSFINSAHYYSCDGITGFLIIGLNNKLYIHKDLPMKVWLSFKNSDSLGSFYSKNIRYRYRLSCPKSSILFSLKSVDHS
jgi:hypothetical protein